MLLPSVYQDNVLIDACGALMGPAELIRCVSLLPPLPNASDCNGHAALHETQRLHDLFICNSEATAIAEKFGMMARGGYRCRNPADPSMQAYFRGGVVPFVSPTSLLTSSLVGVSGQGKSAICSRSMLQFAQQVVVHKRLPGLLGPQKQLVYLRVEVPTSGTLEDLAYALMEATDRALETNYFGVELGRRRMDAPQAFKFWLHFARLSHLGIVIFDEFQNLLKLTPKKERAKQARTSSTRPPLLTIVQDKVLQEILSISNAWRIPCVFVMTPDGLELFSSRFAVSQRLCAQGADNLPMPKTAEDPVFIKEFLEPLAKYQYLPEKIALDEAWRKLLFEHTGYVRRIVVTAWCQAQRLAIRERAPSLRADHLQRVMREDLAPLRPAIAALHSGDPNAIRRYHDLLLRPNL